MASSQEKVVQYYIARLKDKRPDVRREAIGELEALGAEAESALDALREVYEKDAEAVIRQAAQKAGLTIFMAAKKQKGE
jgi:HEAT repeat protein